MAHQFLDGISFEDPRMGALEQRLFAWYIPENDTEVQGASKSLPLLRRMWLIMIFRGLGHQYSSP